MKKKQILVELAPDLRRTLGHDGYGALALGLSGIGDGGGGFFYFNGSSTSVDDSVNIFKVDGYAGAGRWERIKHLYLPQQIEITATTVDLSLGTDFWKEITANLTLTITNATDGKKASISIRNTDTNSHTVTISGVSFPGGSGNSIPAGGRAHISLQQINGVMDASIVIYEAETT